MNAVQTPPEDSENSRIETVAYNIAIISPGDRVDKMTDPIDAIGDVSYTVNPGNISDYDAVICDTPDRQMFKTVVKRPIHNTPVIFRMRGDPFWGIDEWMDSRVKARLSTLMLSYVDACVGIAPHQIEKYERKTGVETYQVSLPKRVENWPEMRHDATDLRLVSLTNATYPEKVDPLIERMATVDALIDRHGGYWQIGSWADGYSDKLQEAADQYEHVQFAGNLDAYDALDGANALLHFSELDVLPNAVLEGFASGLPVITNDHEPFKGRQPNIVVERRSQLRVALADLSNSDKRQSYGEAGIEYVQEHHHPRVIGEQLRGAIDEIVGGLQ